MEEHENIKFILTFIDVISWLLTFYQLIIKREFSFGIMLSIVSFLLTLYLWCINNMKKARGCLSNFTVEKKYIVFLTISILYLAVSLCCLLYSYFTGNYDNIYKSLYIPQAIYSLIVILIKFLVDTNEICTAIYACISFIPLLVLSIVTLKYDITDFWSIISFIFIIGLTLIPILSHQPPLQVGVCMRPPKGPLILARLKGGCRKLFYWLPLKSGSFTIFFS